MCTTNRVVTPLWKWARSNARIENEYIKEPIAEFLGTAVLCFFAFGANAQGNIMEHSGSPQPLLMEIFGSTFGFMLSVFLVGGVSGAHVNPAVTLGLAIAGEVSWLKVPVFWVAQIFGGFMGALLGYSLYEDTLLTEYKVLMKKDGSALLPEAQPHLAALFSPIRPEISLEVGIADQTVSVAILLMGVFALIDNRNMRVPKDMLAFFVCLVVGTMGMCFNVNAGAVLNPARDLGPRLAALCVGFQRELVMENVYKGEVQQWWLVGIIGPLVGGATGTILYIFLIGAHLPDEDRELKVEKEQPILSTEKNYNINEKRLSDLQHIIHNDGLNTKSDSPVHILVSHSAPPRRKIYLSSKNNYDTMY